MEVAKELYFSDYNISKTINNDGAIIKVIQFNKFAEGGTYPKDAVIKEVHTNHSLINEAVLTQKSSKNSNYIIKIYYSEEKKTEGIVRLFLEYCKNGDLNEAINKKRESGSKFEPIYLLFQFKNLAFAIKRLHELNIAHRDIKPGNIFLTINNTMKIGDFGVSKEIMNPHGKISYKGTVRYMPLYFIKEKNSNLENLHGFILDVYGFGKSFLEALSLGYGSFKAENFLVKNYKEMEDRNKKILEFLELNELGHYYEFIVSMLKETNEKRISMSEVYDQLCQFLNKELKLLQFNRFVCFLCSEQIFAMDFITLSYRCNNHPFHIGCYKEYISCSDNSKKCPLCDFWLSDEDFSDLVECL